MRKLIVGLVFMATCAAPVAADESAVKAGASVGIFTGTALLATAVGTADLINTLPMAVVPTMMVVGSYLEATSNCAAQGKVPHVRTYNQPGNRGFVTGKGSIGIASEENVKWEDGPDGWKRLRCD